MAKHWISGAIKHPGALHRELGVPKGQKIPAAKLAKAAHAGGKLGQRARLAETLKGLHHSRGKAERSHKMAERKHDGYKEHRAHAGRHHESKSRMRAEERKEERKPKIRAEHRRDERKERHEHEKGGKHVHVHHHVHHHGAK